MTDDPRPAYAYLVSRLRVCLPVKSTTVESCRSHTARGVVLAAAGARAAGRENRIYKNEDRKEPEKTALDISRL